MPHSPGHCPCYRTFSPAVISSSQGRYLCPSVTQHVACTEYLSVVNETMNECINEWSRILLAKGEMKRQWTG